MRKIMFRGLSEALNYMVHGYYLYEPKLVERIVYEHWIVRDDGFKYAIRLKNAHTIGQYTGIKDKNGVGIYEGDILKTNYTSLYGTYYKGVLKFGEYHQDGSGGEYNPSKCLGFYIEAVNPRENDSKNHLIVFEYMKTSSPFEFESLEVIGNIHEHPHLLEVSTE